MATSGLHRLWWTSVYARGGNRLHSVQPCPSPRARHGRLLDGFLPLRDEGDRHFPVVTVWFDKNHGPELRERCRTFPGPAGSFADRGFSIALAGCGCRCATTSRLTGSLSQLSTQGDTLSAVRFLMGCFALRRFWNIDTIFLAYLPSRAVGVAAPPSFFGSPAHWRPLASQMFACSQLKTFRHPCAVLVPIAVYRFSP